MNPKLDHIAIATEAAEETALIYERLFGLKLEHTEEVTPNKTRVAFLPLAGTALEMVEPMGDDSPLTKYLQKKGPGLHHLCFEVEDIDAELERLASGNVQLIDRKARPGAHDTRIAFIHPKATGGVLVELCEKPKS